MVMLVHLAPERAVRAIRRSGIRLSKYYDKPDGVFAMPVMPNFVLTHQWLRELRRGGHNSIAGVYFRLPGDEPVFVGRYNQDQKKLPVARAVKLLRASENALGYEFIVPRKIMRREICRVRALPQTIGWRYFPEVRQVEFCGCPMCVPPGGINSRRKREKWEKEQLDDE